MTVAALPGNVRLRAFQLGLQSLWGTPVNATRRVGWTYTPATDLHWTFPVSDTGTLDRAQNPYRMASDVDGQSVGPMAFNDLPGVWAALLKGGITASGGGSDKTWGPYNPASTSQDPFDIFTAEWGDETTDQYQLSEGIINRATFEYPEDLGPVIGTFDWYFGNVVGPGSGFTKQALSVDFQPNWMYAADTSLYIDSTAGGIEGTQLLNTLHGATLTIDNAIDKKRFLNGSNTRFQLAGYGRGARIISLALTNAKSTVGIAEVANWLNANPVERFLGIKTISPAIISGSSTPYSNDIRLAGFWSTNTYGTYGTANTTDVLTCEGFLDQTLGYPISVTTVCGRTTL